MKKVLSYAGIAILLGAAMMLAPWMLVKSGAEEKAFLCRSKGEETLGGQGDLERLMEPPNLSSAGLMLIPSFLLALGVSLYLRKRMF